MQPMLASIDGLDRGKPESATIRGDRDEAKRSARDNGSVDEAASRGSTRVERPGDRDGRAARIGGRSERRRDLLPLLSQNPDADQPSPRRDVAPVQGIG